MHDHITAMVIRLDHPMMVIEVSDVDDNDASGIDNNHDNWLIDSVVNTNYLDRQRLTDDLFYSDEGTAGVMWANSGLHRWLNSHSTRKVHMTTKGIQRQNDVKCPKRHIWSYRYAYLWTVCCCCCVGGDDDGHDDETLHAHGAIVMNIECYFSLDRLDK